MRWIAGPLQRTELRQRHRIHKLPVCALHCSVLALAMLVLIGALKLTFMFIVKQGRTRERRLRSLSRISARTGLIWVWRTVRAERFVGANTICALAPAQPHSEHRSSRSLSESTCQRQEPRMRTSGASVPNLEEGSRSQRIRLRRPTPNNIGFRGNFGDIFVSQVSTRRPVHDAVSGDLMTKAGIRTGSSLLVDRVRSSLGAIPQRSALELRQAVCAFSGRG